MISPVRIAMWSGPRNISTAMMRSFGARADCEVSDEPFYGAFLKASSEPHPMAKETMAAMDCDWESIKHYLNTKAPGTKKVWYQKHMPHHMVGPITIKDFPSHKHAFLIRSPERVIASYRNKNDLTNATMLGFKVLRQYFDFEADRIGSAPIVVDADEILKDPEGILRTMCFRLGIPWDPSMLKWRMGPHPYDGVWGAHWYDKVNSSTCFGPLTPNPQKLTGQFLRMAESCRPDYLALKQHSILS